MGWLTGIRSGVVVVMLAALLTGDGIVPPRPALAEPELFDRLPRDRDDRAVVAALGEIDPCGLLAAGPRVPGLELRRTGPHRCALTDEQRLSEVSVELGMVWEHNQRYRGVRSTVGGFKAYADDLSLETFCWVRLPVSFRRVISFDVRLLEKREVSSCGLAQAFAAAGVAALDTGRGSGPLQSWSACSLLKVALGDEVSGYTVWSSDIDTCGARVLGSQEKPLDLALDFGVSDDMVRRVGPLTPERHPARLVDRAGMCVVGWTVDGSSTVDRAVLVHGKDCTRVERFFRAVRTVLSTPRHPVAPQRPLLYRPDEPDTSHVGACVDYQAEEGSCQPYVEGPLPPGRIDLPTDARTVCGAAAGPAGKHLPELSPIVAYNTCVFVEPSHTVQVKITTKPGALLQRDPYGYAGPVTLGGRPGLLDKGYSGFSFVDLELAVPGGILRADLENLSSRDLTPALLATFAEIAGTYFS